MVFVILLKSTVIMLLSSKYDAKKIAIVKNTFIQDKDV